MFYFEKNCELRGFIMCTKIQRACARTLCDVRKSVSLSYFSGGMLLLAGFVSHTAGFLLDPFQPCGRSNKVSVLAGGGKNQVGSVLRQGAEYDFKIEKDGQVNIIIMCG